jgi:hypothetical protein
MKDGQPEPHKQRSPGGHPHPGAAAQSFPRRELSLLIHPIPCVCVCVACACVYTLSMSLA